MRRLGLSLLLIIAALFAALPGGSWFSAAQAQQAAATDNSFVYRLGANDRLRVIVFGEPDLTGEFEVDGRGNVSMPLVGSVSVIGLTLVEAERALENKLRDGFLQNPRVNVEVLNYRPFFIIGEVNTPGRYPYVNGMLVLNAAAIGGGFTYRADRKDVKIRRETKNGTQTIKATLETVVQPGDVIEIGERFF